MCGRMQWIDDLREASEHCVGARFVQVNRQCWHIMENTIRGNNAYICTTPTLYLSLRLSRPSPVNVVIKTITLHHTTIPIHSPNFQTPQWLKHTPHIATCPLYHHGNIQIAYLSFSSFPPPPPVTPTFLLITLFCICISTITFDLQRPVQCMTW